MSQLYRWLLVKDRPTGYWHVFSSSLIKRSASRHDGSQDCIAINLLTWLAFAVTLKWFWFDPNHYHEYIVHPCTGRTAYRESRGTALPFLDHGTWRGWEVSLTPRPLFTPGKDSVPIVPPVGLGGPQGRSGKVRKISPPPRNSIPGPSSP